MAKITDNLYLAGTVNHVTRNERRRFSTDNPYLAGTVNHATKNEMAKIIDSLYSVALSWMCYNYNLCS